MDAPNMPEGPQPAGFQPAGFSPGFLDHGGPYFLKAMPDGPAHIGLRVEAHHINYADTAHGGVIATLADVALSYAVYDAQRPRLAPSTITLTTNYCGPARLGDWLEAKVQIDRLGGRTAYTSGRITCGDALVATMTGVFAVRR